ncbi:MAG TPA: glycosyltransferase family 61 protein [Verrucomicrobiae bacterium]|nr:glycosyltransferase family 61 protein [Verrucomicrobiae bacterium]
MRTLGKLIEKWIWKPSGFVPSLEALEALHGVKGRWDVTTAVSGPEAEYPLTVVELENGKILGDLRIVATGGDIVVGGLQGLFGCPDPQNHYLPRRRRFRMTRRYRGTALLLGAANSDNYYHWLVDSVPRWKILQAANCSTYDFVLLHSKSLQFQDEVLDRLNVPRAKRLRCSKNFVHQFERLIVPSMPFPPEQAPTWSCSFLRSLFPEKHSGPEMIYLRRGPGRRRLINEAELEAALAGIGFVSIDPGGLTVLEQAKLLSSAQCIVAPHGAALTNAIFAPPGAYLVELFHPEYKNRCYVNIASTCGHRYASLDGCTTGGSGDGKLEYTVDVPATLRLTQERA